MVKKIFIITFETQSAHIKHLRMDRKFNSKEIYLAKPIQKLS